MSKPKCFPTPDPPSAALHDLQPLWSHQTPLDSPQNNFYPFPLPKHITNTDLTCSWSHKSTEEQFEMEKRGEMDLPGGVGEMPAGTWELLCLQRRPRSVCKCLGGVLQVPGMNIPQHTQSSLRIVSGCSQGIPCSPGNTKNAPGDAQRGHSEQ